MWSWSSILSGYCVDSKGLYYVINTWVYPLFLLTPTKQAFEIVRREIPLKSNSKLLIRKDE